MNKKLLDKLKFQAAAQVSPLLEGSEWQKVYSEKFAELIVRECVSKCEVVANMATITNTGEMARKTKATADSCATMIKEHFGVEE